MTSEPMVAPTLPHLQRSDDALTDGIDDADDDTVVVRDKTSEHGCDELGPRRVERLGGREHGAQDCEHRHAGAQVQRLCNAHPLPCI